MASPLFTFLSAVRFSITCKKDKNTQIAVDFISSFFRSVSISFGSASLQICFFCSSSSPLFHVLAARRRNRRERGVAAGGGELGLLEMLACGLLPFAAAEAAMVGAIWREGMLEVGVHDMCGEELGTTVGLVSSEDNIDVVDSEMGRWRRGMALPVPWSGEMRLFCGGSLC
jgi:hypothetical protein